MAARSPLGRAIEKAYGGYGVNIRELVEEIQKQAKSDRAAAKLVGIHHRTWQRWRKGEAKPKAENLLKATAAVRGVRAKDRPMKLNFSLRTRDRNDGRERTITGSQLGLNATAIANIEAVYVSQGPDAAADQFVRSIADDFYADYMESQADYDRDGDGEYGGDVQSIGW